MQQQKIVEFFEERKKRWLKKKQKNSMSENEILALKKDCEDEFSLSNWLPKAAKRAGQMSMCTHPCKFSHPSAKATPIIANKKILIDGYFGNENANINIDAFGNAAALDVYTFLNLKMDDNLRLIEHIKNDTDLAKSLLRDHSYDELKKGFLKTITPSNETFTSSKIKQVYFLIGNKQYHLLSILTNSAQVFKLKEKIDTLRFDEEIKKLRALKKDNKHSEKGYMELYDITSISYGGTKPQNISVLNSKNRGRAHLLNSMPPSIKRYKLRFPKKNFFGESITKWDFKYYFIALNKIFKTQYNNKTIRERRIYLYEHIIDIVIQRVYAVRDVAKEQYFQKTSKLKTYQKILILDEYKQKRELEDEWLEKLTEDFTSWFVLSFEKIVGEKIIVYGEAEINDFKKTIEKYKEAFK